MEIKYNWKVYRKYTCTNCNTGMFLPLVFKNMTCPVCGVGVLVPLEKKKDYSLLRHFITILDLQANIQN